MVRRLKLENEDFIIDLDYIDHIRVINGKSYIKFKKDKNPKDGFEDFVDSKDTPDCEEDEDCPDVNWLTKSCIGGKCYYA